MMPVFKYNFLIVTVWSINNNSPYFYVELYKLYVHLNKLVKFVNECQNNKCKLITNKIILFSFFLNKFWKLKLVLQSLNH